MSSRSRSTATLVGAAAACVAVWEGARTFAVPSLAAHEELSAPPPAPPALRGSAAEPSTSSFSLPLAALSAAAVGVTAVKVTSRRRVFPSHAQTIVRLAGVDARLEAPDVNVKVNGQVKSLAELLSRVAGTVLDAEKMLSSTQAQLADKEAALDRSQAKLLEAERALAATQARLQETEKALAASKAANTDLEARMKAQLTLFESVKLAAEAIASASEKGREMTEEAMLQQLSGAQVDRALLLDCDGTLVETERDGHRVSFNQAFAELGFNFTWDVDLYGELLTTGGGKERMTWYFKDYNPGAWRDAAPPSPSHPVIKELHARKTKLFMDLVRSGALPLREGIKELISNAHRRGWKLAICSTSNEESVKAVVETSLPEFASGIRIFAGDMVAKKKPNPAIYNMACEKLGVSPTKCVVVEDTAIGLQAGKAAGMKVIVTKSIYSKEEDFTGADLLTDSAATVQFERDVIPMDVQDAGQALLLDCDGTLVETERDGHRVSFNQAFAELGFNFTWDVELYGELLTTGGGKERMTRYFKDYNPGAWRDATAPSPSHPVIKELHARKTKLFMDLVRSGALPLRGGIKELISNAHRRGWKLAICSTSNEESVKAVVETSLPEFASGIRIFAGDMVAKKKPNPAIYNMACEQLGVSPTKCVVVEDTAIGLQAGKAAGMKVIVTKSIYSREEDFTGADLLTDSAATVEFEKDVIPMAVPDVQPTGATGALIKPITEAEVYHSLNEWGAGVVDIGSVFRGYGDYVGKATALVKRLYAFDFHPVLLKPSDGAQPRSTVEGVTSFLAGGPEDKGLALRPWARAHMEPGLVTFKQNAVSVKGTCRFVDYNGGELRLDFSCGYKRDPQGQLRLVLQSFSA